MSGPSGKKGGVDPKNWVQELKGNRKTQAALLGFALVLTYLLWPAAPRKTARTGAVGHTVAVPLDDRQFQALQKLKDLTQFDRAGELPDEDRMYRDLFLFDMPPPKPKPPVVLPKPPEPPPKTPEQLAEEKLAQEKEAESNSRPQSLRYLGYMGRVSTGRIGSFMKGEEILSYRVGDLASPNWKLVALTDTYAEFQNQKFADIRYKSEAKDSNPVTPTNVTNQF